MEITKWQDTGEQCLITSSNPVHSHGDSSWWFCDETWSNEYGPYPNEDEANKGCGIYCDSL